MSTTVRSPFATYVDYHDEVEIELPFVHTTECTHLRSIGVAGELQPRDCPVFKKPLLYLFYGRPAYRSKRAWESNAGPDLCPICFVLKPNRLDLKDSSIFPFDTGAAADGKFEPYVSQNKWENFSLSPEAASLRRCVSHFFVTNGNYFIGEPRSPKLLSYPCTEATGYWDLVSNEAPAPYDDRRSSLEVALSEAVALKDSLMTIILPFSMLGDSLVRDLVLKTWGLCPIGYNTVRGTIPGEYQSIIRQKLHDYLKGSFI